VKAGGKDLLMLIDDDGDSCLFIAAYRGHTDMAKVRQDICAGRKTGNESVCRQIGTEKGLDLCHSTMKKLNDKCCATKIFAIADIFSTSAWRDLRTITSIHICTCIVPVPSLFSRFCPPTFSFFDSLVDVGGISHTEDHTYTLSHTHAHNTDVGECLQRSRHVEEADFPIERTGVITGTG